MPHQPGKDGGRALRPPARRAGRPPAPLTGSSKLFVVTGPSGAGKGTLIRELVGRRPDLEVAVSATTRLLRRGEVDGREYYFLSEGEFARRVAEDEFLEHVVYVSGQRYGTLRSEVERILAAGRSCVLELETQGAKEVEARMPDAVSIFVQPPSFAELERRLRERATESSGEIGERLALARRQMDEAGDFDHTVTNAHVEEAVDELEGIVDAELTACRGAAGKLSAT